MINNQGWKLVKIFFHENSVGGFNIYRNFSEIVIKGNFNVRELEIVSLSTVTAVGKA